MLYQVFSFNNLLSFCPHETSQYRSGRNPSFIDQKTEAQIIKANLKLLGVRHSYKPLREMNSVHAYIGPTRQVPLLFMLYCGGN